MDQILQDIKSKVAELEAEARSLIQSGEAEAVKARAEVQALIARLQALLGSL